MLIYLFVFFLSWILLKISLGVKNNLIKKLLVICAILLPSLLAGLRDFSIGTDTRVYGNIWFSRAVNTINPENYIRWGISSSMGMIYTSLNFIVSRFTDNPHWFYFVLNLLTNALIYKAIKDNEDIVRDIPTAMLLYYLFYYNQSLNLMRQSLAMAFVLCTFVYIRKQKWIHFAFFMAMGILSHTTAIIALSVCGVYLAMKSKLKILYKVLIVFGTLVLVILLAPILNFLINEGIISNRYAIFADSDLIGGGKSRLIMFCLPYTLLFWIFVNSYKFTNIETKVLINTFRYLLLISTIGTIVAFGMTYITRILFYFDIFMIIGIPYMIDHSKLKITFRNKNVLKYIFITIALIYWIYSFAVKGFGETVPYVFMKG